MPGKGGSRIELVPLAIFSPPSGVAAGVEDEEIVDLARLGALEPQLDVDRLAADQVAGAGHDVERGQAAGDRALEARDRARRSRRGCARRAESVRCRRPRPEPARIPPMWLCVQISPGMMTLPATSIFLGAGGNRARSAAGPTAVIFPFSITSAPPSISSPSMGMILAPTNARGRS